MVCGFRLYSIPYKVYDTYTDTLNVFLGGIVMAIQILIIYLLGRHKSYEIPHDTQNGKKGP